MIIKLAFRNIFRNKVRTSLIAIIFVISSFSIVWILAFFAGLYKSLDESMASKFGDVYLSKGDIYAIQQEKIDLKKIKKEILDLNLSKEIKQLTPILQGNSLSIGGRKGAAAAVLVTVGDIEQFESQRLWLTQGEMPTSAEEIVIGQDSAMETDVAVGDIISVTAVTEDGIINVGYYRVSGFHANPFDATVLNYEGAASLLNNGDRVSGIKLNLYDRSKVSFIKKELSAGLRLEQIEVRDIKDIKDSLPTEVRKMRAAFLLVIPLALFIIFMASGTFTGSFIYLTMEERIKEIGTYMALGIKEGQLFGLLLMEAAFLALFSGILGVLLGVVSCYITTLAHIKVNIGNFMVFILAPTVTWQGVILAITFVFVIAIAWGMLPAYRMTKKAVVKVLYHV